MKKLFALVLTLALVFAIAAPAMAATWGAPTAPTGTPFGTTVTLLQSNKDAAGNTYYTAYPANLGVVAGTTVLFQISFTVPTEDEVDAYYPTGTTAGTLGASAALKNLKSVTFVGATMPVIVDTITDSKITFKTSELTNAGSSAKTYSAMFTGTVETTGDATITAKYGYSAVAAVPVGGFTKTVSGVTYSIKDTAATAVTTASGTNLALALDANKQVVGMTLRINGGTLYTVYAGPVFQYAVGQEVKTLTAADADYAAVLAAYNAITGILGFKAGDTGIYYTTANVIANYGYANAATAVGTYKGYTSSLTVSDNTSVPNTGDAVSVLGFVMVGLALLATAAVVVKKVRA